MYVPSSPHLVNFWAEFNRFEFPVFVLLDRLPCQVCSTIYCREKCCKQYWTSPGGNTPQGTNNTANCLPSRKLYKLDKPDTQDTAGEARTNSSVMYSYGPSYMAKPKQDDQLEHTYSSYVRIRDVALKTCQKQWMIGRNEERGSGISVLAARHDDDDDDFQRVLALCEMQTFLSRIWTQVSVSTFYDVNHYTTSIPVYVCMHPLCHEQDVTYSQFTADLNSKFSFSYNDCFTKAEELSLPFYLLIAEGRADGFMPYPGVSSWNET